MNIKSQKNKNKNKPKKQKPAKTWQSSSETEAVPLFGSLLSSLLTKSSLPHCRFMSNSQKDTGQNKIIQNKNLRT